MIPTPFRFLEVEEEELAADTAQLDEAKLGVAPKALDPVDVVFSTGKLVFMMMDAMVLVALEDEAVVGFPAVGVNVGVGVGTGFPIGGGGGGQMVRCQRTLVFRNAIVVEQTWNGNSQFCSTFVRR